MNKIIRTANISFETRDVGETGTREVEGLAVVFNQPTDLGWFTEEIDARAFDNADMSDVVLLFNHDENYVLAGTRNGSLSIEVTPNGLVQRGQIIDTMQGNDVYKLVKSGLINKMSFAFTIGENGDEWRTENGREHRVIRSIDKLYDVSLVTRPAYENTVAFARSLDANDKLVEEHKQRVEQDKRMKGILNGNLEQ